MPTQRHRIKRYALATFTIFAGFVYVTNTSRLAKPIGTEPILLAHRGLGQDYSREGLTRDTCTASRMLPSGHEYLENTIPSIKVAFDYGADIVEFDINLNDQVNFYTNNNIQTILAE